MVASDQPSVCQLASWFHLELYILTPHDLPKLHGCMDPTVASLGLWQVARALLICYIPLSLGEIWWQLWALRASDSCCPPRWNTPTNLQTGSCVPMHVTWYDTHMARTHHLFVFCLARFGTNFWMIQSLCVERGECLHELESWHPGLLYLRCERWWCFVKDDGVDMLVDYHVQNIPCWWPKFRTMVVYQHGILCRYPGMWKCRILVFGSLLRLKLAYLKTLDATKKMRWVASNFVQCLWTLDEINDWYSCIVCKPLIRRQILIIGLSLRFPLLGEDWRVPPIWAEGMTATVEAELRELSSL